jgi:predicted XRE-type DNA-binding protein
MKEARYQNVFDALESDSALAQNLKIRSRLMSELSRYVEQQGLTQREAADFFEVSQPRISDLVRGKIERFTIDMLVNMLSKTGKHIKIKVSANAA